MKSAIVSVADNSIASFYDGEADQGKYGGPWGDINRFIHATVPSEMGADLRYLSAEIDGGVVTFEEDSVAKAAAATADAKAYVEGVIAKARSFGDQLINQFAAENVMLGITADEMTGTVRKNLSEVMSAIQSGSLRDAIDECRAIPSGDKDVKYITDARLLAFINKIETYLGETLSVTL